MNPFKDILELQKTMSQCHDILRLDKPRVMDAFDEISKIFFAKILDEIEIKENIKKKSHFKGDNINLELRIQTLFQAANIRFPGIFEQSDSINLREKTLSDIVKILSNFSILKTSIDLKGAAYESFLKSAFPVGKIIGQFFTPLKIVEFIISMIDPSPKHIILDPACGSGGFLLGSARYVYNKYFNSDLDFDEVSFLSNNLYGIDIDPRMTRLSKLNLLMHGINYSLDIKFFDHIITDNGLIHNKNILDLHDNSIDIVLTNPPFGGVESDYNILRFYSLGREKTSRGLPILFLERCIQLLKPGGKLAIVLPDSILNGSSNTDVRSFVKQNCNIIAIIKLPSHAFVPYGSSALSSILIVEKKGGLGIQRDVFMAIADDIGYNNKGKQIELNDFPFIQRTYHKFKNNEEIISNNKIIFKLDLDSLEDRLDVTYYNKSEYYKIMKILNNSKYPIKLLKNHIIIKRVIINPSNEFPNDFFYYIGLGDIESETGRLLNINNIQGKNLTSSYQILKNKDIIFAKLRPYLKKCVCIEKEHNNIICSSEFLVFRAKNNINEKYLAYILRTNLIHDQLKHLYTGLGRPRIPKKDILELKIPVPEDIEEQVNLYEKGLYYEKKSIEYKNQSIELQIESENILRERDENLLKSIISYT